MASSSSSHGAIGTHISQFPSAKDSRRPRILLAASGSMDALNFRHLCVSFTEWADVKAVATTTAMNFIARNGIPKDIIVYTDDDEWKYWRGLGDHVLHIDLQKWADFMVIAPLSANSLAKIAGGLCDNLMTSIVRAWDYKKPIFVAPAMNSLMWSNPLTEQHLTALDEKGINLIPPESSTNAGSCDMARNSRISETIRICWDMNANRPGS